VDGHDTRSRAFSTVVLVPTKLPEIFESLDVKRLRLRRKTAPIARSQTGRRRGSPHDSLAHRPRTLVGVLVAGCAGARSTWRMEVTEYSPTEGDYLRTI
jgi:hypothetical protein